MASVPGHDFDPRTRSFTDDELKPQPMVKKSRKQVLLFAVCMNSCVSVPLTKNKDEIKSFRAHPIMVG